MASKTTFIENRMSRPYSIPLAVQWETGPDGEKRTKSVPGENRVVVPAGGKAEIGYDDLLAAIRANPALEAMFDSKRLRSQTPIGDPNAPVDVEDDTSTDLDKPENLDNLDKTVEGKGEPVHHEGAKAAGSVTVPDAPAPKAATKSAPAGGKKTK